MIFWKRWHKTCVLLAVVAGTLLPARPAAASYASIMLNQGIMLVENRDYQKAIGVFHDLSDALPRYWQAHEWLVKVYTKMGLADDAKKEQQLAATLKQKYEHLPVDDLEELNMLTSRQPFNRPSPTDRPLNPANRDLQAVPANSFCSIWLNRVIFLYMTSTWDLALRGFQDLAKSCPRYDMPHEWLAKTYEQLKLTKDAEHERQLAQEIREKFGHLPKYRTEEPLDPNENVRMETKGSPSPAASAETLDNSQLEQHEHR